MADTVTGARQHIPGGPVASQEVIKELGTNGGGFYNANSAHPFENPASWTNWVEIVLILLIPISLCRTFGRLVGQNRQGYAILAVMGTIALPASPRQRLPAHAPRDGADRRRRGHGGVETRFGVANSATFAGATTLTSTGAVDSFHDSYTSLGGMVTLLNMMLGEVAPGGAYPACTGC